MDATTSSAVQVATGEERQIPGGLMAFSTPVWPARRARARGRGTIPAGSA